MRRDKLTDPAAGPDSMWSTELPPSRGQLEAIAVLACDLLGIDLEHRLHASIAITRLRLSLGQPDAPAPATVQRIEEF